MGEPLCKGSGIVCAEACSRASLAGQAISFIRVPSALIRRVLRQIIPATPVDNLVMRS